MAKQKKIELNDLNHFALDMFIIKIFDFKKTLTSFSTQKHIYTQNVDYKDDKNEGIISYKIYNKKLINGCVDENFTIKNFTPYTLYQKLFNDETFLISIEAISMNIKEFKEIILKSYKIFGFKNLNILSLYILNTICPEELDNKKLKSKKFEVLSKEELKIIENNDFSSLCVKKTLDKYQIEEKLEKIINTKEVGKNNKWLDKTLSFPGIYFIEHFLQLISKTINK